MKERMAARSGVFSTDTTSRSKKVLQAAERQRADVARARRRWIREQGMLDPARLVFIDETAVSTNMVRLRGRAPRGVRVIGAVPLGRWQTITFVAAPRYNKMVAPMVVEGAMTGEMFLAYVENCLVPMLRCNDIVVMDNCRVHLGPGIGRAIETVGATLRYLPKYSPDLNPIEMPYSKFKTFLRGSVKAWDGSRRHFTARATSARCRSAACSTFLSVMLCRSRKRQSELRLVLIRRLRSSATVSTKVRSGRRAIRSQISTANSSNGETLPPRGFGASLRCSHFTADATLTSKRSAASRRDAPVSTAVITRSRRSRE